MHPLVDVVVVVDEEEPELDDPELEVDDHVQVKVAVLKNWPVGQTRHLLTLIS